MPRRRRVEPVDREAVIGLVLDRADRGRWPTAGERHDLAGRDGVLSIGPAGAPSCVLMPADTALAERIRNDPLLVARWSSSEADCWDTLTADITPFFTPKDST